MSFTDREILQGIAGAIGLLFVLYGWHFLDNRKGHRLLYKEISEAKDYVVNCVLGRNRGGK